MKENSKKIYDSLITKEDIDKLVSEKVPEGLYLEFKKKVNRTVSTLDENDKKNFSEAISQFANSDGGVLVFGIETSKQPYDSASKADPITNPRDFMKRLNDYIPQAIQPSVDMIESKVIDQDGTTGYVLFHIPTSHKSPHRAMPSREYCKRGQNGKYKMEHFDLEDMFGRRQKPLLSAEIKHLPPVDINSLTEGKDTEGYLAPLQYELYIFNEGRYVAKNAMLIITAPDEGLAKTDAIPINNGGASVVKISDLRSGTPTIQVNMGQSIFYPTISSRVITLQIRINADRLDSLDSMFIKWDLYAEDMIARSGTIIIKPKEQIR